MKVIKIKARVKSFDLLPCPFCGSKPQILRSYALGYQLTCPDAGCAITVHTDYYPTQTEAVEVWNNRRPLPVLEAVWIKEDTNPLDGNYYCSYCGEDIDIATGEETPLDRGFDHCPKCGTIMSGTISGER